jgi:hypothetical protein
MFELVPAGKRAIDFRSHGEENVLAAEPETYDYDGPMMHGTSTPNLSESMLGFYGLPLAEAQ